MTRAARVRWVVVPLVLSPAPAAAADPAPLGAGRSAVIDSAVRVETSLCPDLRSERVAQLLRLELATLVPVVSELPTLDVELRCGDALVRIALVDPVTRKRVMRDVLLGPAPDPERTLALAASELFLASWAELLIPSAQDEARAADPAAVAAKGAVERVVPARQAPASLAVDLRGVGRVRHVGAPVLTLGAALRVGRAVCAGLGVVVDAGWERGSVSRSSGQVDVMAATLGMGGRWCVAVASGQLGVSATVGAAYVSLQGVSSSPVFYGARHDGFTAEASGSLDANVTLGTVRLGAALLAGALAPGPSGHVDGAASVQVDGAYVGATVFAGLLL